MRRAIAIAGLLLLASALLAACRDSDAGLTRAEVEEIVRAEMAEATPNDDRRTKRRASATTRRRPCPRSRA